MLATTAPTTPPHPTPPCHAFCSFLAGQWIASLMVIIIGSTLLCQFNKCTYTTAAILYTIGCLFDLLAVGAW